MADKKITLKSSDGLLFEIDKGVARHIKTINPLIEDGVPDGVIPLYNVNNNILTLVIDYCKKCEEISTKAREDLAGSTELRNFCVDFVDRADLNTLFDLMLAANYLEVNGLLHITCERVANMIKGNTPEEIRKTFHIKNDFTLEEEAIREENAWVFL